MRTVTSRWWLVQMMLKTNHCRMQDRLAVSGSFDRQGEQKTFSDLGRRVARPILTDCSKGSKIALRKKRLPAADWQGGCIV